MRRGFGIGLSVLGGFLVVLAVLAQFWAPGQLMKTPLDVDSTTLLDGTAELSDGTGGTDEFPVKAFSVTRADSERSDADVIVFQNSSCLVKDEGDIDECVSADDPRGAAALRQHRQLRHRPRDRDGRERPEVPPGRAPSRRRAWSTSGPSRRRRRPTSTGTATPARRWTPPTTAPRSSTASRPTSTRSTSTDARSRSADGVQGTYSTDREIWVDPTTGAIVNQSSTQERLDDDGNPFLALDYGFTDDQVAGNAEDAKTNASSLNLVTGPCRSSAGSSASRRC